MNTFRAADTARHDEDLAVEASSMSLPDEIHCTFGFTVDADQNDGRPALVDNLQCRLIERLLADDSKVWLLFKCPRKAL